MLTNTGLEIFKFIRSEFFVVDPKVAEAKIVWWSLVFDAVFISIVSGLFEAKNMYGYL